MRTLKINSLDQTKKFNCIKKNLKTLINSAFPTDFHFNTR